MDAWMYVYMHVCIPACVYTCKHACRKGCLGPMLQGLYVLSTQLLGQEIKGSPIMVHAAQRPRHSRPEARISRVLRAGDDSMTVWFTLVCSVAVSIRPCFRFLHHSHVIYPSVDRWMHTCACAAYAYVCYMIPTFCIVLLICS